MYVHPNAEVCSDSVRMAVHFFVNFDIFKWLYLALGSIYTKLGHLVKLGLHFIYDYVDQWLLIP